jgi:hypothetical protein
MGSACLGQAQAVIVAPITDQAGQAKTSYRLGGPLQIGRPLPIFIFKIFNKKLHFLSRKCSYKKIQWRYL